MLCAFEALFSNVTAKWDAPIAGRYAVARDIRVLGSEEAARSLRPPFAKRS
jgi:hypothetical protein